MTRENYITRHELEDLRKSAEAKGKKLAMYFSGSRIECNAFEIDSDKTAYDYPEQHNAMLDKGFFYLDNNSRAFTRNYVR